MWGRWASWKQGERTALKEPSILTLTPARTSGKSPENSQTGRRGGKGLLGGLEAATESPPLCQHSPLIGKPEFCLYILQCVQQMLGLGKPICGSLSSLIILYSTFRAPDASVLCGCVGKARCGLVPILENERILKNQLCVCSIWEACHTALYFLLSKQV